MLKSSYPPIVKNYLKAVPAVFVGTFIFIVSPIMITISNYRWFKRNPVPIYHSDGFGRRMRVRDDKFRHYTKFHLMGQPGMKKPDQITKY